MTTPTTTALATAAGTATPAADTTLPLGAVQLDTPIKRAGGDILVITVRKPSSGELRGVALAELLQMDVVALQTVLPRITQPTLTKPECASLDPADLVQLGTEVVNFLLPKAKKADVFPTE